MAGSCSPATIWRGTSLRTTNASGVKTKRVYRGSYYELIDLYTGNADAALTHLYDWRTTRTTLRSFSVLHRARP